MFYLVTTNSEFILDANLYGKGNKEYINFKFRKLTQHARRCGWKQVRFDIYEDGGCYELWERNGRRITVHIVGEKRARILCPDKF